MLGHSRKRTNVRSIHKNTDTRKGLHMLISSPIRPALAAPVVPDHVKKAAQSPILDPTFVISLAAATESGCADADVDYQNADYKLHLESDNFPTPLGLLERPLQMDGTQGDRSNFGNLSLNESEAHWKSNMGENGDQFTVTAKNDGVHLDGFVNGVEAHLTYNSHGGNSLNQLSGYLVKGTLGGWPYQTDTVCTSKVDLEKFEPGATAQTIATLVTEGQLGSLPISGQYEMKLSRRREEDSVAETQLTVTGQADHAGINRTSSSTVDFGHGARHMGRYSAEMALVGAGLGLAAVVLGGAALGAVAACAAAGAIIGAGKGAMDVVEG